MNNFITIIFITFSFVSAPKAEWQESTISEDAFFYLDTKIIKKNKNIVTVWELQELRKPNKNDELSYRYMSEYDCKKIKWRIVFFTTHSGPTATGNIIRTVKKKSKWKEVPPDTPAMKVYSRVCLNF